MRFAPFGPDVHADSDEIAGGIERDANGIPCSIHVMTVHPGNKHSIKDVKWIPVPIYGTETKRRQVLHLMGFERIDQSRGEPCLACDIETLKQLSRFAKAEISVAVVNAVLAVYVKRPLEGENEITGKDQYNVSYTPEQRERWEAQSYDLGPGAWIDGAPGEELQVVSANRPNAQFDPFFNSCIRAFSLNIDPISAVLEESLAVKF